jgi:thiol-disulfide isomerase/thioredoxin
MKIKNNKFKIYNLLFILVILCYYGNSYSQKKTNIKPIAKQGYEISIQTQNLVNETVQLSFVFGTNKKNYVVDSVKITNNIQKVVFKEPKKIVGAIYKLALKSNPNFIELAIDNGNSLQLKASGNNIQNWEILSNALNKDFLDYQRKTNLLSKPEQTESRNQLQKKYQNTMLYIYFWAENKTQSPKITDANEQQVAYDSFFDTVSSNDKRLAFLPNINKLLYKLVTILPLTNENYIKHIDKLLKGLDCKTQNYSIFTKYISANLAFFESTNLEIAYNHLYENYIKDNTCKSFSDTDMNKFTNEYDTNKKVPLNSVFPELTFAKKDSTLVTIQEIYSQNEFTLITFFSPTCQHCIDKMPEIKKFMVNIKEKYPNKKTAWVAILNDKEEDKWLPFIEKNQLDTAAINLKSLDPNRAYQQTLNAYSNPCYFLVNKEGKVMLKSFNNKAILEIINR